MKNYDDLPVQAYSSALGFGYYEPYAGKSNIFVFERAFPIEADRPFLQAFSKTQDDLYFLSSTVFQKLRSSPLKSDPSLHTSFLDAVVELFLHNSEAFGFSPDSFFGNSFDQVRFSGNCPSRLNIDRFIAAHYLTLNGISVDYGVSKRKKPNAAEEIIGYIDQSRVNFDSIGSKLKNSEWKDIFGNSVVLIGGKKDNSRLAMFCLEGIHNCSSLYRQIIQAFPDKMKKLYHEKIPADARLSIEDASAQLDESTLNERLTFILSNSPPLGKKPPYLKPLAPFEERLRETGL
ncbi:MAG TPA: hypothetical protein ENN46_01675 [Candidatus Woesearchaeota archaeon]|nr:hypothetical protein [Candidatus Woesearchaeota archaeon]